MPPKKDKTVIKGDKTKDMKPRMRVSKKKIDKKVIENETLEDKEDKNDIGVNEDKGEDGDCMICCMMFNKSIRSKSSCPHCNVDICKRCIQTYLLETLKDPHCMNCKNYWSQEILQELTSKSFRTKEYKEHRQNVLLDREKGYLQLSQPYVEDTMKSRKYTMLREQYTKVSSVYNSIGYNSSSLKRQLKLVKSYVENLSQNILEFTNKNCPEIVDKLKRIDESNEITKILDDINIDVESIKSKIDKEYPYVVYEQYIYTDYSSRGRSIFSKKNSEKYKYNYKCQNGECKGFLNDEWYCGVCSHITCKKCMISMGEIIDLIKLSDEKSKLKKEHVCKDDDIRTAELIRKDSKPCPKCHTLIFHMGGCRQMFCTYCKTAFDWNNGEIINNGIHNPHYFEWRNGKLNDFGVGSRREEEQTNNVQFLECCAENGFVPYDTIHANNLKHDYYISVYPTSKKNNKNNRIENKYPRGVFKTILDYIIGLRNHYNHLLITIYVLENAGNIHQNDRLMRMRVDYVLNEISENEWKAKITQEENKYNRVSEIRQLIELLTFASGESILKLRNIVFTNTSNEEIIYRRSYIEFMVEIFNLILYVENQFEKLQSFYNVVLPYFNYEFIENTRKIEFPKDIINMTLEDMNIFMDKIGHLNWWFDIINGNKDRGYNRYYNYYEETRKKDISHLKRKRSKKVNKSLKEETIVVTEFYQCDDDECQSSPDEDCPSANKYYIPPITEH